MNERVLRQGDAKQSSLIAQIINQLSPLLTSFAFPDLCVHYVYNIIWIGYRSTHIAQSLIANNNTFKFFFAFLRNPIQYINLILIQCYENINIANNLIVV